MSDVEKVKVVLLSRKLAAAHEEAAHWQAHFEEVNAGLKALNEILTDAQKAKLVAQAAKEGA